MWVVASGKGMLRLRLESKSIALEWAVQASKFVKSLPHELI